VTITPAVMPGFQDLSSWAQSDLLKRLDRSHIDSLIESGHLVPFTSSEAKAHPYLSSSSINDEVDGYLVRFDASQDGEIYRQKQKDMPGNRWHSKVVCQFQGDRDEGYLPPTYMPDSAVAITEGFFDAAVPTLKLGVPVGAVNSPSLLKNLKAPAKVSAYIGDVDTIYGNCDLLPLVVEACSIHGWAINVAPRNPVGDYTVYPLREQLKWGLEDAINEGVLTAADLKDLIIHAKQPADFLLWVFEEWQKLRISWKTRPEVVEHGVQACALVKGNHLEKLRAKAQSCLGISKADFNSIVKRKAELAINRDSGAVELYEHFHSQDAQVLAYNYAMSGETVRNEAEVVQLVVGGLIPGFRWNILSDGPEWKPCDECPYEPIEPTTASALVPMMVKRLSVDSAAFRRAIVTYGRKNPFNPLENFLRACSDSDLPIMELEEIAGLFGLAEDDHLSLAHVIQFFTGVVIRWRNPGAKLDIMLNWQSRQGYRKSTVIKALGGMGMFYAVLTGAVNIESRESLDVLHAAGLVELAESDTWTLKGDDDATKRFLSTATDKYNPKYKTGQVVRNRAFAIVGSTNETGIYRDNETRRFLTIQSVKPSSIPDDEKAAGEVVTRFWKTMAHLVDSGMVPPYFDNTSFHGRLSEQRNQAFMVERDGEQEIMNAIYSDGCWSELQVNDETIMVTKPQWITSWANCEHVNPKIVQKIMRAAGLEQTHRPRKLTRNGKTDTNPRLWTHQSGQVPRPSSVAATASSVGEVLERSDAWFL